MAYEAFFSIVGEKEGQYPAETQRKPHVDKKRAAALRVDYRVSAPTDIQKTSLANERRHEPITILKEVGAMTALLNKAANRNELLKEVEIVFFKSTEDGEAAEGQKHYFTIKLKNARIASHRVFTGLKSSPGHTAMASASTSKNAVPNDTLELEEFTLWFGEITLTAELDKVENTDAWNRQQTA